MKKSIKKHLHFRKVILYNTSCVTENVATQNKPARLAQLVEHLTLNQGVQGSSP